MEIAEKTDFKVLQTLLSSNEISEISSSVCEKLENFFRSKFDEFITSKAVFETNRKNLDKKCNDLTNDCKIQKEKLDKCEEKLELAEKFGYELQSQLDENRSELYRLQECIKRL
ncbi:PREDICTED: uncharacterized protein LOC105360858, partial [Ceratosolen solmsi marchali]|uniref:Uncharacterized protein LOC105360858 n=1 Tax=Ceratosolen solmsi marchali TaxID=326594 RepID=A0AAJ6YDP3_9HYME